MRFIPYLRYFFYVAWNWGPAPAFFILYHEIRGERKYHLRTIGADSLRKLRDRGIDLSHAHRYMPVNYYVLEHLMREISRYPHNKTFLDLGCGKGRAMMVAADYGFEDISGVDLSPEFRDELVATIAHDHHLKKTVRFTIVTGNAADYEIPSDVTTIFLFNPFDEVIVARVISNIQASYRQRPRTIRILYANPVHKPLFIQSGFREIYELRKLDFFEGSILEYR
ncbi:MAG TPA: class I SAM-dependent methyltransferase [Puia sp.]|nr:class I SAM-dependent methyltransferase [Puia sp.]